MKKLLSFILALLVLISSLSVFAAAVENEVGVVLNGFDVIFDVPGRLIGDRTMVPLRKTAEALGAQIKWIGETSEIILTRDNNEIRVRIGSFDLYKNGILSYTMDIAPVIIEEAGESRTLVPLRAISEAFGCTVKWDGATRTAYIYDISDDTVMTIGDYPVYNDLYSYFALNTLLNYDNLSKVTKDSPVIAEIEAEILQNIADFCAVKYFSSDMGLSAYSPEIIASVNDSLEQYKQHYGESFEQTLTESNMTEKVFTEFLYISLFENALLQTMQIIASTMPASEKATLLINDNNYIRAAHILCDDAKTANKIHKDAVNANNTEFFDLVSKYGTDPGMESNTQGYYFAPGRMVKTFENAAFALAENTTSGIIKSEYGYHIIRRLPKDEAYITENADTLFEDYIEYQYRKDLSKISEVLKGFIEYLPAYSDIDLYSDFIKPAKDLLKHNNGNVTVPDDENITEESDKDYYEDGNVPDYIEKYPDATITDY